jgi:hypothetical protein
MEPATYPARVVHIIDLGMQEQRAYADKVKPPVNMVAFTYEFADEFLKDEDGNDIEDKPRHLTEMMPIYQLSADKAKSTLRYNALDPAGAFDGDFSALVGLPCLVTVVHNPNKKTGGVYENIGGISPMREKDAAKAPELVYPPLTFDLDEPDLAVFEQFPQFVRDRITNGLEYEGSKLYDLMGSSAPAAKPAEADEDGDDNPF